ncbi:serine/threonine-protein kinase [Myxococcus sp. RHSTA-1-4]|uniref:serine/threonine protein kinase n=1 Tax=Myxococcus sp. RHSTA-1-4 TaxID=2874601 RepID=UPI001CBD8620|nr:serine/threonine-protein kinase [Myxococcus sp. RHSTA-1-4]MBZ4418659.1 serine/threonine protein kinase [Myxococcus sp. RHSTA-1-4]
MGQGAWKAGRHRWQLLDVPEGTNLAGFTVESLLGTGARGAVYRARRGGERFALKLQLLEELAGWAEREVTILLRLQHPNVAGFRACGTWPDRAPRVFYLAMELIEGRPLHQWVRENNPCARQAALLLRGLARGLAATHAAGVLHRDVKEFNIVVRDATGEPVLVDFGVGDYTGAPRLTWSVLPPGTPLYRSPEALAFREAHWNKPGARYTAMPADDLYALGVVFHWVLTGRHPFSGTDTPDTVIQQPPPVPHELNPRVPPVLSALCLRLLSKTPEARGGAEALGAEVEALLARADAAWELPLREKAEDPPAPLPRPEPPVREAPVAVPGTKPGRPRSRARPSWRAAWVAGLAMCLGVGLFLVRGEEREARPASRTDVADGREMAHPASGPEPVGAAIPPEAVTTSAAAALAASQQEPDMSEKTTPSTANAPTEGWGAVSRILATAAACTGLACASGPQVSPRPPSEPCPPGSQEAMKALGIEVDNEQHGSATFSPRGEGRMKLIVHEGPVKIRVGLGLGKLDNGTATGRLFMSDRVFGYFDQATTKHGQSFPVCLILKEDGVGLGLTRLPGDTAPGTARIDSEVRLMAVERFE